MGKLSRYILKGMMVSQGRFFVMTNEFARIPLVQLRCLLKRNVLWDRLIKGIHLKNVSNLSRYTTKTVVFFV